MLARAATVPARVVRYGCTAFSGACAHGSLVALVNRTQDSHCGSCDPGYTLASKQCAKAAATTTTPRDAPGGGGGTGDASGAESSSTGVSPGVIGGMVAAAVVGCVVCATVLYVHVAARTANQAKQSQPFITGLGVSEQEAPATADATDVQAALASMVGAAASDDGDDAPGLPAHVTTGSESAFGFSSSYMDPTPEPSHYYPF